MGKRAQGTDITLREEFSRGLVYRGLAKALETETGTFLHRGLVKYHGGSIHRELYEIVERGLCKLGFSLYGSSVRGTWSGGSFAKGPAGYERKALGMGISLPGGSVGQTGVGSSTWDFEI
jgi:hypothetical protein